MVTQLVPRVDLDVAAGEKDDDPVARSPGDESFVAPLRDEVPEGERPDAARRDWFGHLHAHEYEPPFTR